MENIKKFNYHILPDLRLIVECWIGDFSFEEIIQLKMTEIANPEWRDDYDVLADDRQSNKNIETVSDRTQNSDTNKQMFQKRRKSAILTSKPKQVVTTILLKDSNPPGSPISVDVFSTIEAALQWLNINPKEKERINDVLDKLQNE